MNFFTQGATVKLNQDHEVNSYYRTTLKAHTKGVVYAVLDENTLAVAFAHFDSYGVPAILQMSLEDANRLLVKTDCTKDQAFGDFDLSVVKSKVGQFNQYQAVLYKQNKPLSKSNVISHHPSQLPITLNDPNMVQPIAKALKDLRQHGFKDQAVYNMLSNTIFNYLLYGFQKTLSFVEYFKLSTRDIFKTSLSA